MASTFFKATLGSIWTELLVLAQSWSTDLCAFLSDHPKVDLLSRGGSREGRLGRSLSLKPTKVTLFTMILYNSENSIRDIRLFCRPLFCHSSFVKFTSSLLQQWTR